MNHDLSDMRLAHGHATEADRGIGGDVHQARLSEGGAGEEGKGTMTCPRAHCGGLLFEDDGEWVCKSCSRRWTDETLELERSRQSKPAPPKATSAIDDAMLDRKLSDLLRDDDGDEETEEETTMAERCQKPRGRGTCKADALPGSKFCGEHGEARSPKPEARSPKPEARSPKPEARSPKPEARRGRPLRHSPAGGFDQAHGAGSMTSLVEQLRQVRSKLQGQLEKVDAAIEGVEGL